MLPVHDSICLSIENISAQTAMRLLVLDFHALTAVITFTKNEDSRVQPKNSTLQRFNNKQEKIEIQFAVKFGISNLTRVKNLLM